MICVVYIIVNNSSADTFRYFITHEPRLYWWKCIGQFRITIHSYKISFCLSIHHYDHYLYFRITVHSYTISFCPSLHYQFIHTSLPVPTNKLEIHFVNYNQNYNRLKFLVLNKKLTWFFVSHRISKRVLCIHSLIHCTQGQFTWNMRKPVMSRRAIFDMIKALVAFSPTIASMIGVSAFSLSFTSIRRGSSIFCFIISRAENRSIAS